MCTDKKAAFVKGLIDDVKKNIGAHSKTAGQHTQVYLPNYPNKAKKCGKKFKVMDPLSEGISFSTDNISASSE